MKEQYGRNTILDGMQTKYIGRTVHFYDCIDSTNVRAGELAASLDQCPQVHEAEPCEVSDSHGHIVVADTQTAGKGRRGRSWESPAGKNIYFSLILKPDISPDKAPMLTLVMAMAVLRALEEVMNGTDIVMPGDTIVGEQAKYHHKVGIKWPNDLVINGKKICGILTEMSLEKNRIGHVVIGVGINVENQDFPEELVDKATSLEAECGQAFSRNHILQEIMRFFEEEYERFLLTEDLSGIVERYNACLINRDREVRVLDPQGEYNGVARGIDNSGELIVELADGTLTNVYAGEVSVRGIYGYV